MIADDVAIPGGVIGLLVLILLILMILYFIRRA